MCLTSKHSLLLCVILCANLSACESMQTHQYAIEQETENAPSSTFLLDPSQDLSANPNRAEELQDEPIVPIHSSDAFAMLTPATFYHSPDPPENLPEYVPSLFFDFDSWILTNKGKLTLELTAEQLRSDTESTIIIEGHCDDRGSDGYNLVLGDKRAHSIQEYLVNLGIEKNRITTVSFGDTHPVCFENSDRCHALNRRGYMVLLKSN